MNQLYNMWIIEALIIVFPYPFAFKDLARLSVNIMIGLHCVSMMWRGGMSCIDN